jgi:hypothetical protein
VIGHVLLRTRSAQRRLGYEQFTQAQAASDPRRLRVSHGSIFYCCNKVVQAGIKRADNASDGCPPWIRCAALDSRECRDGDASLVGHMFLSDAAVLSQLAQDSREDLVWRIVRGVHGLFWVILSV